MVRLDVVVQKNNILSLCTDTLMFSKTACQFSYQYVSTLVFLHISLRLYIGKSEM